MTLTCAEASGIHLSSVQVENWQNAVILGPRLPRAMSPDRDSPFFWQVGPRCHPSWPGWTNRLPSAPESQPGGGSRGSS